MATPPTDKQLLDILRVEAKMPDDIGHIICGQLDPPFIFALQITADHSRVTIPSIRLVGEVAICWGDGQTQYIDQNGPVSHEYAAPGTYTAWMRGHITGLSFCDMDSLVDISQWGCVRLTRGRGSFRGCRNLLITAEDILDVSQATDLSWMFSGCKKSTLTHVSGM